MSKRTVHNPRVLIAELLLAGLVLHAAGCSPWRGTPTAYFPPPPRAANTPQVATALVATGPIIRAQDGYYGGRFAQQDAGSESYTRNRMPVTVAQNNPSGPAYAANPAPQPAGAAPLFGPPPLSRATAPAAGASSSGSGGLPSATRALSPAAAGTVPGQPVANAGTGLPGMPESVLPPPLAGYTDIDPTMSTPVDVYVQETQTGRFMFGVGVNSDAGVTGQIVLDERNFDITAVPRSWSDFAEGTAFRGRGQGFRVEAMPGTQVQRYLASFTEPYLFNTPISGSVSGFLFDRRYLDWTENRAGGRVGFGYRLTHDLSLGMSLRAEHVRISDPRVVGYIPDLDRVVGGNDLFSGRVALTHDTRDFPFAPTEGHLFEISYEQAFGDFSYPRGELDFRKYFLVRERPDGSGRHTLGFSFQVGVSGSDTPIFENYFAGGFSTLRGFDFRGASPVEYGVRVGGRCRFIGSTEYIFPLTADDMLRGAFFCDFGTVERDIEYNEANFRIAPGFGVRINIPAMGPAPLAFDFAFPVHKAATDDTRVFSFFVGVGR